MTFLHLDLHERNIYLDASLSSRCNIVVNDIVY